MKVVLNSHETFLRFIWRFKVSRLLLLNFLQRPVTVWKTFILLFWKKWLNIRRIPRVQRNATVSTKLFELINKNTDRSIFLLRFCALQLIFICYWFKSRLQGLSQLRFVTRSGRQFLLKIANLLTQIPHKPLHHAAYLKIDTSLLRLNLWVSKTPGRTPERFGY